MSGSITGQGVRDVSTNTFHLRDGMLFLNSIAVSYRVTKQSHPTSAEAMAALDTYPLLAVLKAHSRPTTNHDAENDEYLIATDIRNQRSQDSLFINLDGVTFDDTNNQAHNMFLNDCTALINTNLNGVGDYKEPSADTPRYNFNGTFGEVGGVVVLNTTSIEFTPEAQAAFGSTG